MVVLTSFPPPTEGIKHVQPNTGAYINSKNLGLIFDLKTKLNSFSEDGFFKNFIIGFKTVLIKKTNNLINELI